MTSLTLPRFLSLALTASLALPLASCECPQDGSPDRANARWNHGRGDESSWPPPTAANPDPTQTPPPHADAGTLPVRDAGAPPITNGGVILGHDGGASGAGGGAADSGAATGNGGGSTNGNGGGSTNGNGADAGAGSPGGGSDASLPDAHACPTSTCGMPMPVCQFDNQCGPGGRCRNGACEHGCADGSDCGTGQLCEGGFCVTPPTSGGRCLYDHDCGMAATCINGVCHARCSSDAGCTGARDRCLAGVCQPDVGPRPQCHASADCPAGQDCVNAVCRTPCETDVECCAGASGPTCRGGVCVTAHEAAPQCRLADQCGSAQSCIDGVCAVQ